MGVLFYTHFEGSGVEDALAEFHEFLPFVDQIIGECVTLAYWNPIDGGGARIIEARRGRIGDTVGIVPQILEGYLRTDFFLSWVWRRPGENPKRQSSHTYMCVKARPLSHSV